MNINQNYREAVKAIKEAILRSQYRAAASVNKEQLSLYYGIGRMCRKIPVLAFGEKVQLNRYLPIAKRIAGAKGIFSFEYKEHANIL